MGSTEDPVNLEAIRAAVGVHRPTLSPPPDAALVLRAAVSLILHEPPGESPELLFIERARHEADPWSGHMAFPGGRLDPDDADIQATAARETLEEVGVALAGPLGRLDDFASNRNPELPPLIISPFVYAFRERPPVVHNQEVQSTVWIPVSWILGPESAVDYRVGRDSGGRGARGHAGSFPAFEYQGYTVWGLTYRILRSFFGVVGREFGRDDPVRSARSAPRARS